MIANVFHHGALQSLERLVQFTGARHGVIAHNIANLSTPYFRPKDLSVEGFQKNLRRAQDRRRDSANPVDGRLDPRNTRQLRYEYDHLTVRPVPLDENILFHDRNNRDLERIMQDLAENTLAHNTGLTLLKSELDLLRTAIRENV